MPSGNATITYTGDEPKITFSGETFTKGQPTHSADQGVIGGAKDRDDFTVDDHRAGEASEPASAEIHTPPSESASAPDEAHPSPAKPRAAPKKKPAAKAKKA